MALDFTKVIYVNGQTVIGAANLNDIQDALLELDNDKAEQSQINEFGNAVYLSYEEVSE